MISNIFNDFLIKFNKYLLDSLVWWIICIRPRFNEIESLINKLNSIQEPKDIKLSIDLHQSFIWPSKLLNYFGN